MRRGRSRRRGRRCSARRRPLRRHHFLPFHFPFPLLLHGRSGRWLRRRRRRCCRRWRRRCWTRRRWCGRWGCVLWCRGRRWRRRRPRGRRRSCWRRRSCRRCCLGCFLRRFLGGLLGLSIGTDFLPGLRNDQWCGLCVRWSRCKLQGRKSCRGKQQRWKFCHDRRGPGRILGRVQTPVGGECQIISSTRSWNYQRSFASRICNARPLRSMRMSEVVHKPINKQGLGRIVAAFKPDYAFICHGASFQNAIIHDAFRSSFQIEVLNRPAVSPWRELGRDSAALTMVQISVTGIASPAPVVRAPEIRRGYQLIRPRRRAWSLRGGGTLGRAFPGGLSISNPLP